MGSRSVGRGSGLRVGSGLAFRFTLREPRVLFGELRLLVSFPEQNLFPHAVS